MMGNVIPPPKKNHNLLYHVTEKRRQVKGRMNTLVNFLQIYFCIVIVVPLKRIQSRLRRTVGVLHANLIIERRKHTLTVLFTLFPLVTQFA